MKRSRSPFRINMLLWLLDRKDLWTKSPDEIIDGMKRAGLVNEEASWSEIKLYRLIEDARNFERERTRKMSNEN